MNFHAGGEAPGFVLAARAAANPPGVRIAKFIFPQPERAHRRAPSDKDDFVFEVAGRQVALANRRAKADIRDFTGGTVVVQVARASPLLRAIGQGSAQLGGGDPTGGSLLLIACVEEPHTVVAIDG